MRRFVTLACSLVVAAVLASGCSQNEGEPCQESDDCSSGLLCCPTVGRAAVERGRCMPSTMCEAAPRDAGPGTDSGVRDAGVRLDAATDAAADVDASVDAGGGDAGAADAGPGPSPDAGAGSDAGSDAGGTPVDAGRDAGVPVDAG